MAFLMGAKIHKYEVLVAQPQVTYSDPKLKIFGNLLISIAPILGGLAFMFFINKYFLANQFAIPAFSNWKFFVHDFLKFVRQINLARWQDWVAIFLFLNMGAMIGPSWQDLKNVWIFIVVLLFIPWPFFVHLGLLSTAFILIGISFQLALVVSISIVKFFL